MKHPTRIAAFRAALLEAEASVARTKATTISRCRAAISAIDDGRLADAKAALARAIDDAEGDVQ